MSFLYNPKSGTMLSRSIVAVNTFVIGRENEVKLMRVILIDLVECNELSQNIILKPRSSWKIQVKYE